MSLTSLIRRNPTSRLLVTSIYRAYARAFRLYPAPRVLVNSVPKAGTHLLVSLLKHFPRLMSAGRHHTFRHFGPDDAPPTHEQNPLRVDWVQLERALRSVNPGQFMTGHFHADPTLMSMVENLGFRTILVMRDPRDIVVSSAYYFSSEPRHYLYERFNSLRTIDERIMAVIMGLPSNRAGRGLEGIGSLVERYLGWVELDSALLVRFEDLIGPRGGGSVGNQKSCIATLAEHVERPMTSLELEAAAKKAWSTNVSTFRRGQIGDWRLHFKESHERAFKDLAGSVLLKLGYESDSRWRTDSITR